MVSNANESAWDDIGLEEKSYLKMKLNMEKDGFRDGIDEGKNQVFQNYFDKGYIDGFKNGQLLGKLKGSNWAKSIFTNENLVQTKETEKSSIGVCILCKDVDNISQPLSKIKSNQMKLLETSINNITKTQS
ncbi:protein yae1-like [Harmonia axyridis]|uniref:protein yae1-like n=1 Tax=Harmonia axyridis TaxID=115357 RepID=UPI001E279BE7|nr:protein yae1-like [Harmonia axyridis]